ncbi:MAG TPA: hypothetical protein DEB06_06775 [Phycisphaerales bacterium]|nr:hypothetical protein [Phycisphaerales bacterium]
MIDSQDDHESLEHAIELLRASLEGWLQFGSQSCPVRYIVDPATGRLVAPVPMAALLATEHLLMVPRDSDDALALIVTPQQLQHENALTDRWRAHHAEPEHVRWAEFWIESAKHAGWVFDGEALTRPNPLAEREPALLKRCNADRAALSRVCQRFAGVVVPDPVCVSVDPGGLLVRARFGVVRVPFPPDLGDAPGAIEGLFAAVSP